MYKKHKFINMRPIKKITALFDCPASIFGFILFISVTALTAAFSSELFLKLEPCILCIYQRYPYAFAIFLSLIGIFTRRQLKFTIALLSLTGLNFLINSSIAFYHSGIERNWWKSFSESCTIFEFDTSKQTLLENILSTPMGRCDKIPWQDPLFGLSMANYNVVLCFGLSIICAYGAFHTIKKFPKLKSSS